MIWHEIETSPPPIYKTVLLYREGDLQPVVGWCMSRGGDTNIYMLEEGGCEAGDHRTYPILAFKPTHWVEIPRLPCPESRMVGR